MILRLLDVDMRRNKGSLFETDGSNMIVFGRSLLLFANAQLRRCLIAAHFHRTTSPFSDCSK